VKRFSIVLLYRVIFLTISILAVIWLVFQQGQWLLGFIIGVVLVGLQVVGLYQYMLNTNRKLTRFFESVRYSDFTVKFRSDNEMGNSFQALNKQFNEVLEAFRQARAEKEANLHYINTIIQHVNVGLLSFDSTGNIELINAAAYRLLGIYRLRNIAELQKTHPNFYETLQNLPSGGKSLYETANEHQIAINATTLSLRGRIIKLISLQNIQAELQQKELEAWQNLTKVLRHEIMNSVTPIVSLVGTMKEIVEHDFEKTEANLAPVTDLKEALQTIESRGKGIMNFVNAYREFTTIPKPRLQEVASKTLINNVLQLVSPQIKQQNIELKTEFLQEFSLWADAEQIEMVLINLIKNAIESFQLSIINYQFSIKICSYLADNQHFIEISDNGVGIEPEALEKIFIPFYTTKKTGSGIGLSLSRQIIQMHGGSLKVSSKVGEGTTFLIGFP
jgi:two-component system, NtrC family, nitrogen regulation sensor histidine kinase NtrY